MNKIARRDFMKRNISTASVVGASIYFNPYIAFAGDPEKDLVWDKAPCRFCATGCRVLVGVKNGKIIAVKGDPQSSVNRGKLCVKGSSLPFIQYGTDRLTKPLVRMANGKYNKRDGKATIWLRPYEPPAEEPGNDRRFLPYFKAKRLQEVRR